MTPKAQQIGAYDVASMDKEVFVDKYEATHRRSASSPSSIFFATSVANPSSKYYSSISPLLNGISDGVTSVISPAIIFSIMATPIAMQYPFIQLLLLLTILVGTSPLYFIILTIFEGEHKHRNSRHIHHNLGHPSQKILHHRRQPSIVGSIGDISMSRNK